MLSNGDVLLFGVVDDIGLDVDRFRVQEGAGEGVHYLTGIEFALGAAGWLTWRFIKGYLKGLEAEVRAAGLDPEQLGERAGRRTFKELLDASEALGKRARARLAARDPDGGAEAAAIGTAAEQLLLEAGSIEIADVDEGLRATSQAARAELVAALVEHHFDPVRAEQVADRVSARLTAAATAKA